MKHCQNQPSKKETRLTSIPLLEAYALNENLTVQSRNFYFFHDRDKFGGIITKNLFINQVKTICQIECNIPGTNKRTTPKTNMLRL